MAQPPATESVIEGEVERVTFENVASGFRVVKVSVAGRAERLTVVGAFPPVSVGARIRVRGRLEVNRTHGEQLRAESVIELAPSTLVGIERYLGAGAIKGVGEKYAARIVAAFGLDTLRVLDETPERLKEVQGLGPKRIENIVRTWKEQRASREVLVFLQSHGVSAALALRVVKRYGARAIDVVSREPYRLAVEVWGVGFKTADRIAQAVGIARDSPERMQAGILQALYDTTSAGHVFTPRHEAVGHALRLLDLPPSPDTEAEVERAVDSLAFGSWLIDERSEHEGDHLLFLRDTHAAEVRLSKRLAELVLAGVPPLVGAAEATRQFEARIGAALAPGQRSAIEQAARHALLVITGGPGVGKTTIVRAILSVFASANLEVCLSAPTGRAAKRMAEATGREALTIHRLLEFDPKSGGFRRDRHRPLEAHAVIVDEASMLDLATADALVQAIAPGTRLILVGDVDQLPSVGPGAVLRDIISSGSVPCARLTQIFRQAEASLIVTNAHRINSGALPVSAPPEQQGAGASKDPPADFFVIERRDPEQARQLIVELVSSRIPSRFGLDPVRDVQVLTPMHRGPAGSLALNDALQAALNPSGPTVARGARTFRLGDKVMQLRNDYERSVFNGDVGTITRIDSEEDLLVVGYDNREVIYETSNLDELSLAYACTVHKSQGSEYPAVVLPLLTSHFVMLSRNLLYTAVTRGKRLVVLVADPRALKLAVAEDRRHERRTRLATRLASEAPRPIGVEAPEPAR